MGDLLSAQTQPLAAQVWGLCMRGRLRTRQHCPACGQARGHQLVTPRRGSPYFLCSCGQQLDQVEIDLRWGGKRYAIIHDQRGERFPSYAHAQRALEVIRSQIDEGKFEPALWAGQRANRLLWENWLADYLAREEARLLPDRRASLHKKRALAKHLAWFNGRNIREIKSGAVQDYFSLPCLRLALAPKTLADLAGELRHIFAEARHRDEIEREPRVPPVQVPEQAIRWLTPAQQDALLAALPDQHRPIFGFLMVYGCRVSEACALCWDRVDPAQGVVHLDRTFSRRRLQDRPKTRRPHTLPIVPALAEYLAGSPRGIHRLPVFRNPEARSPEGWYTEDFLANLWRRALEDAGLAWLPLKNGTRHSRGMQALNLDGWGMEAVRRLLGHTSTAHTRKYAEADVELLRDLLTGHGGEVEAKSRKPRPTNRDNN